MQVTATKHENLVVSNDSGIYYCRMRHNGRLFWRSLEVKSLTKAKALLPDVMKEIREANGFVPGRLKRDAKFHDGFLVYKKQIEENTKMKPRTKAIRLQCERTLARTWAQLSGMEMRRVTPEACKKWMLDFKTGGSAYRPTKSKGKVIPGNSPTVVNGCITFLQSVFAIGVSQGILVKNPASVLEDERVGKKEQVRKIPTMPGPEKFAEIVKYVREGSVWGERTGNLIEGLAYSGCRISELRRMQWKDIHFDTQWLVVFGTKSRTSYRQVPLTPAFQKLVEGFPRGKPEDPVFAVQEATESLKNACKKAGVPPLTHQDLRHFFATSVIQSGVSIFVLSKWLGHADGGKLAMDTYIHLLDEYSQAAARKVQFN